MVSCFKCSQRSSKGENFFCQSCGAILPALVEDPYVIFSLKDEYKVNLEEVVSIYDRLQTKMHPDNFQNIDKITELFMTQHIMLINQAYKTLLSPRLRSEFLLKQRGLIVNQDNKDAIKPSPEFLMEIFLLKESAEEIEGEEGRQDFIEYLQRSIKEISDELEMNFLAKEYDLAVVNTMKYRYFEKTLEELL